MRGVDVRVGARVRRKARWISRKMKMDRMGGWRKSGKENSQQDIQEREKSSRREPFPKRRLRMGACMRGGRGPRRVGGGMYRVCD